MGYMHNLRRILLHVKVKLCFCIFFTFIMNIGHMSLQTVVPVKLFVTNLASMWVGGSMNIGHMSMQTVLAVNSSSTLLASLGVGDFILGLSIFQHKWNVYRIGDINFINVNSYQMMDSRITGKIIECALRCCSSSKAKVTLEKSIFTI